MRGALIAVAACGGTALPAPSPAPSPRHAVHEAPPIDPISVLAVDAAEASYLTPAPIQIELGGTTLAPSSTDPIEVAVIEKRGTAVRVGVMLDVVRFAVWTTREHLFGVLSRDIRINPSFAPDAPEVTLHAGARVQRLDHREEETRVRYFGALEIEGWLPDSALVDRGPRRAGNVRVPSGRTAVMVVPGAVIRDEPRWGGRQLAVVANGYYVDKIKELGEGWVDVGYEDGDMTVRGFVGLHDPPGPVHRAQPPDSPPPPITPTAKLPQGTCLYTAPDGEAIGMATGELPAVVEPSKLPSWSTVTIDSPWGPLAFTTRADFAACTLAP